MIVTFINMQTVQSCQRVCRPVLMAYAIRQPRIPVNVLIVFVCVYSQKYISAQDVFNCLLHDGVIYDHKQSPAAQSPSWYVHVNLY